MKLLKILGFATIFVVPAFVLWKGLLYTDHPALEEFTASKPGGTCSYLDCQRVAEAPYPVKVTEGTQSTINKITVYVGNRTFPLCSKHARYAASGRWPQQGTKWFLGLGLWIFLSGFISLGVSGLALYVMMSQKKKTSSHKVKCEPPGSSFRPEKRGQGSVTSLRK